MLQLLEAPAQTGGNADQQFQAKKPREPLPGPTLTELIGIDGHPVTRSWDKADAAAEREAEALEWLEENTPEPIAHPRKPVFSAEQLSSVVRPDDKRVSEHRTDRIKRIRRWIRICRLQRLVDATTPQERADAISALDWRDRRVTTPAAALTRIDRITRWNLDTTDDRKRQAARRLNRARLLFALNDVRQQYVPFTLALRLCDMGARTLHRAMQQRIVHRLIINGQVHVGVAGLKAYLRRKIRVAA